MCPKGDKMKKILTIGDEEYIYPLDINEPITGPDDRNVRLLTGVRELRPGSVLSNADLEFLEITEIRDSPWPE